MDQTVTRPAPPVSHRNLIALIIAVSGLGPMSLNIIIPSMPAIARDFSVDYSTVQFALTLYLLAVACGMLVFGPLSDRFGRKRVLVTGLLVFIAGGLWGATAQSVEQVIGARIVQAFGGCTGMVVGRAMVRDLFDRTHSASIIGYVATVMVVAPMVAPAIGGLLEENVGWRASFASLSLTALPVLAWTLMSRAETRAAGDATGLLRGMATLLRIPVFLLHCAILGSTTAVFFTFLAGAPLAVIEGMKLSPFDYGIWFMSNAFAYIIGNFLSGRFSVRTGTYRMVSIGTALGLAGALMLLAAMYYFPQHPMSLFGPVFVLSLSQGLTIPNGAADALSVRPELAGAAAGLSGFSQVGVGAIAVLLIRDQFDVDGWSMSVAILVFATIAFVLHRVLRAIEPPTSGE